MLKHWCLNFIPVFLISSYGAQLALYLALHSSLFGPDEQLIVIILSLTALLNWLKVSSQCRHTTLFTVPDIIKFTYYHCTSIDYSVLYE